MLIAGHDDDDDIVRVIHLFYYLLLCFQSLTRTYRAVQDIVQQFSQAKGRSS